mmetsp:Transcript_16374/g.29704  ORF Transcript_16374/g.29704 Transcript_16374/m.29704 type:complete len:872 (-) Transcript_16374:91-2706(-)|eukprot:CAMPEP_0202004918 /NCGR_PEP_ID=MMETSP0905-20130828/10103_1 /ASSEMBLY_ACC=CAM_ASM_000554 /TAXON_ID=420261 /ORGANISM="Thalassiosira antarctica, Strain CCMP982" /LENGTH=871 /DNA_ID=CAMNT_0048562371 /DNA_START=185 /DNA_END=2800 /DNA_ORIENTATION=+
MVEFGLKLEDNKVDEWSSQYIDYEKLKAVLKRAKASAEYRDGLLKRMPPGVVVEVVQERRSRSSSLALSDNLVSKGDLPPTPTSKGKGMVKINKDYKPLSMGHYPLEVTDKQMSSSSFPEATDATPLLGEPIKEVNSWSNLHHTVFKVTSYLGLADDRPLLLQAYGDADDKLNLFKQTYEQEVNKVKDFYEKKTNEISQRMEVLVESAGTSGLNIKKQKHHIKSGLVESITQRFESMLHGNSVRTLNESSLPDLDFQFSASLDDEDPGRKLEGGETDKKKKKEELARNSDSIKRAITDIYRTAKLLHNFSIMNYTGFVKIAKKFDKTFPEHKGIFKGNICDDGKQAEVLASKMEIIYSNWFCEGDIREAQAQILTKKGDGLLTDWSQLRLGYRLGMCSILAMWVAWDCVWGQISKGEVSIGGRSAFPVFRGIFGLLAWHWFWGMAVYVWTRYRINYIYLFEFDPRNVDTPIDIFNDAVDETLVFLICMLMYYKADAGDMPLWIPPRAYPSFLILYTIKCLIFPWKMRRPLWIAIKQVVMAPFISPTFFLTYVGDVFTSMVKVFQDLLWTVCFVASGDFLLSEVDHQKGHIHAWTEQFWYKNIAIPLICLMPLWIRFNQCLRRYLDTGKRMPNLANAFKYALSQSVTLFGVFHPLYLMHSRHEDSHTVSLTSDDDDDEQKGAIVIGNYRLNLFQLFWMGLFVSSSLYSFCWDVYMDWGLGRREYDFLGPRLMFPRKSQYYTVICADLVLRFMWVLTLIPPQSGANFELPAYLTAISMTVELFRRTIWSLFRLEHEHRQNTEGFRRVNVVPLHFNTNHKHKYHQTTRVGWKVLLEIVVVTSIVATISAFSVIVAQRATHQLQMSSPSSHARDL